MEKVWKKCKKLTTVDEWKRRDKIGYQRDMIEHLEKNRHIEEVEARKVLNMLNSSDFNTCVEESAMRRIDYLWNKHVSVKMKL